MKFKFICPECGKGGLKIVANGGWRITYRCQNTECKILIDVDQVTREVLGTEKLED